jgi:hypothetical protein
MKRGGFVIFLQLAVKIGFDRCMLSFYNGTKIENVLLLLKKI